MRALSWKQPYASLMLHGKIETRTWRTNYRGWVLICASKQPYSTNQVKNISGEGLYLGINKILSYFKTNASITGKIIGIGELVDCRPMTKEDEESCYVKYREGLWCHVYENVSPIVPIDWKGTQGWKIIDKQTYDNLKIRIKI